MLYLKVRNLKQQNVKKIVITVCVTLVIAIFLLLLVGSTAHAAGLVDDTVKAGNEYSKYPLNNYQLDFYVDDSWSWLPWNWSSDIGKQITYGFYMITNAIWIGSNFISSATGYLVQQAYKLDFITSTADAIGKNIQTIAGVSKSGFSSGGFYEGFSLYLILAMGVYVGYVGIVKKETTKAVHAVINFVVIFILSMGFIAYAPDYIKNVNEFSSDLSTASLNAGTKVILPDSNVKGKDSVDLIRDSLFAIQVKQPWMLLEFGNSDIKAIGENRVKTLVSTSTSSNDGKDRENVVKNEIENNKNNNLTVSDTAVRFGMVIFIFLFNIGISIFVFLLTGIMLFSQILFIIFAMFLPISFLLSMIPTFESMTKRAIMKLFNIIMLRAAITLIITTAFSISSMIYSLSSSSPFFLVAFLQIVTFAGIYFKLSDLLGVFSVTGGEAHNFGRNFLKKHKNLLHKVQKIRHPFSKDKNSKPKHGAASGRVSGKADHARPSSLGNKVGRAAGKMMDAKDYIKDTAGQFKENIMDLPDNAKYAMYHGKSQVKDNVSDFKNGIIDARKERQQQRKNKQAQHRENIENHRSEMNHSVSNDKNNISDKNNIPQPIIRPGNRLFKDKSRPNNVVGHNSPWKSNKNRNIIPESKPGDKSSMQNGKVEGNEKNVSKSLDIKRPTSTNNKKLRKKFSQKVLKNNTSDSSNEDIPGSLNIKRPVAMANKELRKSDVETSTKNSNVDTLNKNIPDSLNIKKPGAISNKELRESAIKKAPKNNNPNTLNKNIPDSLIIKRPAAMANKELRKSAVENTTKNSNVDTLNKNIPENSTIKRPAAMDNKELRKSAVENTTKNSNLDSSNKDILESLNIRRPAAMANKELRKSAIENTTKNSNVDTLNKNIPENSTIKRPAAMANKELRKSAVENTTKNSNLDSSNKDIPESLNIRRPAAMANKELKKSVIVKTPKNITFDSSNNDIPKSLNINKPSAVVNKELRRIPVEKTSSVKTNITTVADHGNSISKSVKMISNKVKENHSFVTKRRISKKKSNSAPALKGRNKK